MRDEAVTQPASTAEERAPTWVRPNASTALVRSATLLASRKRLILLSTSALMAVGVTLALLLPNTYSGVVKIMSPQQNQSNATALLAQLSSATAGGLAAAAGRSLLKDPNELYIGIAKSRPVADALIARFGLQARYRSHDVTGARLQLASNTTATSTKDGIITIVAVDRDPRMAADLANGYVAALTELVNKLALTEASQRRLFYDHQVTEAKEKLDEAEAALQTTQKRTGVVQIESQAKALVEVAERLQERIAAKEVELQGLRTFATGNNIQVQMVEQELGSLHQQLRRADLNRNEGDPLDLGIRNIPQAQMEYVKSAREFKFRETLFEFLTKQLEASKLDEARDSAIIQVIEPAVPAERKLAPHRLLIVVLFSASGFFGACLFVLAADWLQGNAEIGRALVGLRQELLTWRRTPLPGMRLANPASTRE